MRRNAHVETIRHSSFLVVLSAILGGCMALPRTTVFEDDFSKQKDSEPPGDRWSVFAGHWVVKNGTLHQDRGDFDLGLVVKDLYLRCDYRMETKVRLVGGGAGAGFYWNVYDALTGETGNMLRYDGEFPIMFGWMRGRGFVGTGGATGDLRADGKWHTMRMDVRNRKGTFDLYWNGKRILADATSFHHSGYAGLECSMGHCEFDDFRITVARGTNWRAAPHGQVAPEWIGSLAILPDGNIVYPVANMHRIQVLTPEGRLVREFGEHGTAAGQLDTPAAVATDSHGRIYVAERGNNRVQVFSGEGESLKLLAPSGKDVLKNPHGVAVEDNGRVWVMDAGNSRVVCLGADGSPPYGGRAVGKAGKQPGEFSEPRHISFIGGLLHVCDTGNKRIQIFDPKDLATAPRIVPIANQFGPCSVAYDGKGTYVVATWRGVSTFDKDWKHLKEQTFDACAEAWPYQAVFDREGNIVLGDWWSHRILIVSPQLPDVRPEVSKLAATSAVVSWHTDLPTPTRLMLLDKPTGVTWPSSVDYSRAKVLGDGKVRTDHVVELVGLKPGTRHTYAIGSPCRMIPAAAHSADYRFVTEAPKGKMAYTEVPLAILCYSHVTFESRKDPKTGKVPDPAVRDEKWFERCVDANEAMRYFYWTNSRFRLDTKCFYLQVTRPVEFAYLGSSSKEVAKDLEVLARREGLRPTDFGAVLVVGGNGCYAYPWPTPWWGGKLTYTTGCCFPGPTDTWLSTHEFHHLTEGWMSMIHFRVGGEGGYGQADTPWNHPGRFGENYDFLAHTLRAIDPRTYLNLAVGKLILTADRDGDGVPDDEPRAPLDEKRAGTRPDTPDSYGNGLTDLQNLTAEIFNPAVKGHKHPLLAREIDLKYPFAVFNYAYERPRKTPTIDGKLSAGEWDRFASTPNAVTPSPKGSALAKAYPPPAGADYRMDTFLNWDDEHLYFAAKAPFPFLMSIQLDCNADGYFHGKDNPRVTVEIPRDETKAKPNTILPPPNVTVWNNVEPVQQRGVPDWTNDLFDRRNDIHWAWGKDPDGAYVIEVSLPKCPNVGLVPAEGKEMAVRLWFQGPLPPTEKDKNPRYAFEMFDSCEYGYFKLVK